MKGIRLILMIGWLVLAFRVFMLGIVRNQKIGGLKRNFATGLSVLLFLFMLAEISFLFLARTHQFMPTFANLNWYRRYDNPINELGYRDQEHKEKSGKKKLLVVGDSFVAGSGIENIKDRFHELAGKDNYEVFTIAKGGWETKLQGKALAEYPFDPDIIVLSWLPNDILDAGKDFGKEYRLKWSYEDLDPVSSFFVHHSYSLNYLYWSFQHGEFSDYAKHLDHLFAEKQILKRHFEDLDKIIKSSQEKGAPLVVVVWPFFGDSDRSNKYCEPVIRFFQGNGVKVVDLRETFANLELSAYLQNVNDAHPNEKAHALVGKKLAEVLPN